MSDGILNQVWQERLAQEILIEPWRIPVVIAAAMSIYVVFIVVLRVFGSRVLSSMTTFDAAVVIMLGAVAGRVVIGHPPTLAAGIIGLVTLVCLEAGFGALRRFSGVRTYLDSKPRVLIAHGVVLQDMCRTCHVNEPDLMTMLRRHGVERLSEVQCLILEPTGVTSLIREGQVPGRCTIEPRLLDNVEGAEQVLDARD